jgi:tryptophan 2,3-dioxygenase
MAKQNDRGIIAESYHELQGLGLLKEARDAIALPNASTISTLRCVLQCAEIALLNLSDLMSRAADDMAYGRIDRASTRLSWAIGFHRILSWLSALPHATGLPLGGEHAVSTLCMRESPAFREFLGNLLRFDNEFRLTTCRQPTFPLGAIENRSVDDSSLRLVKAILLCNHEATLWEENLSQLCLPREILPFDKFVSSPLLREAVIQPTLLGDTYFTQFRGLHQIPETLCAEVADLVEATILDIRHDCVSRAVEHLRIANSLMGPTFACVETIAQNMAPIDYYEIRENLGLTSGSHSVTLEFHLFRDLSAQLWAEIEQHLGERFPSAPDSVERARLADSQRHAHPDRWLTHELVSGYINIRDAISRWRHAHMHLPRNNLGGHCTRSLTGSTDAIQTVKKMRDTASSNDAGRALYSARGIRNCAAPPPERALADYLESSDSLDHLLLDQIGTTTQRRFPDVQGRTGIFAGKCPFSPPPPRIV